MVSSSSLRRALRVFAITALTVVGAAGLAACGDDDAEPADVPNLDGEWGLDATSLPDPVSNEITDANRPTITFASTAVSGFAGCNTFTGTVEYDDKDMDFGPLATTMMACEEPATSIESTVLQLMDQVRGYELNGTRLRMKNGDGLIVLTFLKG